jgi:hypothetical protein
MDSFRKTSGFGALGRGARLGSICPKRKTMRSFPILDTNKLMIRLNVESSCFEAGGRQNTNFSQSKRIAGLFRGAASLVIIFKGADFEFVVPPVLSRNPLKYLYLSVCC